MTSVKYFHSAMTNAPVLNGVAGSLIAVLDACLKDGFGLQTASSVVVASGIATASFASGHSFAPNTIALIAGATPSGLNGEKRILTTSTNTVTFDATGITDQTATGTITAKLAPAGWDKAFSSTNLAAYRASSAEGTRMYFRVDDAGTTTARVVSYESMTDINTGTGPFPTAAQVSGGMYWGKSSTASSAARPWMLWADGAAVHVYIAPHASYTTHGTLFSFGEINSDKSGDAYRCLVTGGGSDVLTATASGCLGYGSGASSGANAYMPRSDTGLGGAQIAKKVAAHNTNEAYSGATAYSGHALAYPNRADNSLRLAPIELIVAGSLRGKVAGVYHTPQQMGNAFNTGETMQGAGAYAGRALMAVRVGNPNNQLGSGIGTAFVDITGPWRE